MYSCGPPHMNVQEWDDQHELTYSSYVRTRDVTLKTCRRRWMIGRNGERRSGISAQAARHDDDDIPCQFRGISVCWLRQTRHQWNIIPFLFVFNVLLAEFTSMLWVIILHGYKSLSHKLHSKWDHEILLYAVIASLIQFTLHLVQISNFAIGKSPPHHNSVSSMLYDLCGTGVAAVSTIHRCA